MRKLVTVRKIDEITAIEGADMIVCASIGGWKVVTKKNEFNPGDFCVYFEIDSFLPENDHRFQFLMNNKIKWNGHNGARLKTIKLRGQISQGLALPLNAFPEVEQTFNGITQDQDFAEALNVLKWEPIVPAQLAGKIKGNFPTQIPKTDQERAQNIVDVIFSDIDQVYEVTTKLEGSSMTVANVDGEIHVCSRNLSLKLEDEDNAFIKTAMNSGALDKISNMENFAFQGELMGPGVQGNHEGFTDLRYYIFDVYNIKEGRYLLPEERLAFILEHELMHVPVVAYKSLRQLGIENIQQLIDFADGPSINHKLREGLVFKAMDKDFSWKIISNKYLLKG